MQISSKYKLNFTLIILLMTAVFAGCKSKRHMSEAEALSILQKALGPNAIIQRADGTGVSRFSQIEQMEIDNAFLEGVKRMMIEDYGTALDIFMGVLQMDNQHAPANFQISRIRLMQNRLNDAEIHAERAHRLAPQNKFYLEHLTRIYRQNNKLQQALNSLEQLTRLNPRNEEYWFEKANIYLMLLRPMEAVRIYDSIEKRHGISDEISMQKIRIFQAFGQEANIRNELQKLIQKFSNETKYWAILAELNMQTGRRNEAYENYQKILSIDSENPYIHLSLADYYKAKQDTVKMFEHLILAFQNPKLDIDAKVTLILSLYGNLSQKEYAYKLLEAMFSAHPTDPKALALYADFLQRDDRYAEAREKYRKVVAIDGSHYLVWEALLICNLVLMDSVALLHDAKEALARFPEQPLVYYMLGTAYNLKSDYVMAMQYLEMAIPLAQSNRHLLLQIYANLGDIYHHLGNHARSDQNYRRALEIDPENLVVLNNFAYFLSLRRENLEEAERMARLVCQREPTNPTFLDTYAWVLYKQGKYDEARTILELALEHGGEKEAVILEHYGDILWKTGEKERALEFWKKAQAMKDKNTSEFLDEKIRTETLIEN